MDCMVVLVGRGGSEDSTGAFHSLTPRNHVMSSEPSACETCADEVEHRALEDEVENQAIAEDNSW